MTTPLARPHLINHRYFLRAAGITLALPLLESLSTKVLGAGLAVGSQSGATVTGQRPMRMVCIGNMLGFHQPAFFPKIAGKNHDLPLLMKPMARPAVDQIVARVSPDDFRMRDLIEAVVASPAFRSK